ncbi:hypothetical protein AB4Z54_50480, partial [Streptomyces sp. MCAF7]
QPARPPAAPAPAAATAAPPPGGALDQDPDHALDADDVLDVQTARMSPPLPSPTWIAPGPAVILPLVTDEQA